MKRILFLAFFMLSACVTKPPETAPPVVTPEPPTAIADGFEIPGYRPEWSAKVRDMLSDRRMANFNKAEADFTKRFCPNYKKLSADRQRLAWGYLIGAMTKYESGLDKATGVYKTNVVYKEKDGSLSEGLFQLTYGNKHCPSSKADGDLHDPIVNLDCAIQLMEGYIARDGVVAAGGYTDYGAPPAKGLARYWAVIRVPDSKSKHHLAEIISMTKKAPGCS